MHMWPKIQVLFGSSFIRMKTARAHPYTYMAGLFVFMSCLVLIFGLYGAVQSKVGFASVELKFTDPSTSGLAIMPASCASSPAYYHGGLSSPWDGRGYLSYSGTSEYGAYKHGVYICVTNYSGNAYYIPANTAAEMNSFKAKGTSIPGVTIY